MMVASQITGLTLPGIIEEPGCRSAAHLNQCWANHPDVVSVFIRPCASAQPETSIGQSRCLGLEWLQTSVRGTVVSSASSSIKTKPSGVLMPVPTASTAEGTPRLRGGEAFCAARTGVNSWPQ